jgi:hypothetical protein
VQSERSELTDQDRLVAISHEIAGMIGRRDGAALRALLAPGFTARTLGGSVANADAFIQGVEGLPGEIEFVRVDSLAVDVTPAGALVTGVQHARLAIDGEVIEDHRSFADWFVRTDGAWRLQAALDIPAVIEERPEP